MRYMLRTLVSGSIFYVVMAACAGGGGVGSSSSSADFDGSAGASRDADGIDDALSGLVSDVLNPVPEASAEPGKPDVVTVPCDKKVTTGSVDYWYAERAYPGRSTVELSAVRILLDATAPPVPGYTKYLGSVYLREGSILTFCGLVADGGAPPNVTFIVP